ncbi:MAG TPA: hypothetical protein DD491_06855 [Halieaceae bacterium]|nr:hypothetical protein [Halieaceae bacterium]
MAGYSRPFEGSPPIDLLHAVCDALIDRHGPRKECLFAFWDGFGLRVNVDTERTTELGQGAHYLMAGDLRDLSLLYQNVKRDAFEFANEIPQAVWPLDHSWFFTSPFYIDSTFLAGPLALIEAVTREAGIESYEIHADDEMDFTS